MIIDRQFIAVSDDQQRQARQQLELPTDFHLVEATRLLYHNTGNGLVQIPLPGGQLVAAFENSNGQRRYGVVKIDGLTS
ncbi:hypothetical protein ACIPIN_19775 [Pseudomonas sp. NPDC087697]|uniref:hypothetical protein n=1 Tax=Pseudomonas sp. NPDC087697 TaxID=3364447 RepID=UPI00380CCEAC